MILGLLHSAWTIFIAFYAFLTMYTEKNNHNNHHQNKVVAYDFYYMSYILLLLTSWLLMKDECIITYMYKKWLDPSYVMGTDGMDLADAEQIFGKDPVRFGINILMVFTVASISLVSYRSAFAPPYIWIPFVACFVIYLFTLREFFAPQLYRTYIEPLNPIFRTGFFCVTVAYLYFVVVR